MRSFSTAFLVIVSCLVSNMAAGQMTVAVRDISPDQSSSDATNPNGASGGRVNGLGVDRSTAGRVYAASEWGGLFRSVDNGLNWAHLDGHVPTTTWDVEVDPTNSNRVYATSFYDGRVNSLAGINVSTDAGATWTRPASATPPAGFCLTNLRRAEPAAFGISIDPANANRVLIGTNCGLAVSTNAGVTWNFVDPTPATGARTIWDVVVHHGGIIDVCGDDGHHRSTDGGTTWTTATGTPPQPLPSATCSLAVSPDEDYVLFAAVGTSIFESDNGGQSWQNNYPNPSAQGRIPFIATNQRAGATYDLWFGDVSLHRGTCTTPSPAAPGGARRCNASAAWANVTAGAHNDSGDVAFAPGVANDACPILFSSDGGVYRNLNTASPGCHTPNWEQPTVTPHALWNYSFSGVSRPGAATEHLYFGNQDTGTFGAVNGGATPVPWTNQRCCDGFDVTGDATRALSTVCCCSPPPGGPPCPRLTRLFISGTGLSGAATEINTYPPGTLKQFQHLEAIVNFGTDDFAVATTSGVFVTLNIGASPVAWTQLGASNSPADPCGLSVAFTAGTPTFFVKSGGCDGDAQGTIWRHQGTAAGGTWQQVPNPPVGSFGIYAVDRNNPQRLIASNLGGAAPRMVMTQNGGTTWSALPALDQVMTGAGLFSYANQSGPTPFTAFNGYPQPTLVAFDPSDADILVAGGADSGVFLSANGGTRWQLVTDPNTPGASGTPHIPRPIYAHFDHDPPGGDINLYLGTRGRGAWRLTFKKVAMPEIQVPAPPFFAPACVGSRATATLNVCNTSPGNLTVSGITSSNADFTVQGPSAGFPVTISHDFCFPFQVSFNATSPGPKSTNLTIASNDPNFPSLVVAANATVGSATAATVIADTGNFGALCASATDFRDLPVTISNSGTCTLNVSGISSSSAEFQMAQVLNFPLTVAPGGSLTVPIRFQPTSAGAKAGTLTIVTNDPSAPSKVVSVTGSAPPEYVCEPPVFAAIDAAVGPTLGSGATGDYTFNAAGRYLAPFGERKTFGVQAQGEYMFYPGRQEGQFDSALLYRRGTLQFGGAFSTKIANLRAEASAGVVSHAALTFDVLMPAIRFGLFGAKGLRETDVVTLAETIGSGSPGQPIVATEQVIHTVDQLGGSIQLPVVPNWWFDGNLVYLHRHAPGVGDTAGGAVRFSGLVVSNVAFTIGFDVNESYLGPSAVGTLTFGITIGRWSRPTDYPNVVNPLGTLLPRIHYDRFQRTR